MTGSTGDGRFDALADRLAERVAERLLEEREPEPLLSAASLARYLDVDRRLIYRMASEGLIPAIEVGNGQRPRLRFDRNAVVKHLRAQDGTPD